MAITIHPTNFGAKNDATLVAAAKEIERAGFFEPGDRKVAVQRPMPGLPRSITGWDGVDSGNFGVFCVTSELGGRLDVEGAPMYDILVPLEGDLAGGAVADDSNFPARPEDRVGYLIKTSYTNSEASGQTLGKAVLPKRLTLQEYFDSLDLVTLR
jgi:hypothetical protein